MVEQGAADQQVAEAIAAEYESLSLDCRADAARFGQLLAPDLHEFTATGEEIGYAGTAELVAKSTDPKGDPVRVENMRGQLLANGLVMVKYTSDDHERRARRTSLWRRVATGRWQIFHHQATAITNGASQAQELLYRRACVSRM
jgi:ribonuclease HI